MFKARFTTAASERSKIVKNEESYREKIHSFDSLPVLLTLDDSVGIVTLSLRKYSIILYMIKKLCNDRYI